MCRLCEICVLIGCQCFIVLIVKVIPTELYRSCVSLSLDLWCGLVLIVFVRHVINVHNVTQTNGCCAILSVIMDKIQTVYFSAQKKMPKWLLKKPQHQALWIAISQKQM